MNENKKKSLALATVVSFVISNPITGYAEEVVKSVGEMKIADSSNQTEKSNKNFENDDSYHGTWEKPFVFPSDKDEELNNTNSTQDINGYSNSRTHFGFYGWSGWNKGYGSYGKYKVYKDSKEVNKGKSTIKSGGGGTSSSGKSTITSGGGKSS